MIMSVHRNDGFADAGHGDLEIDFASRFRVWLKLEYLVMGANDEMRIRRLLEHTVLKLYG